jgi:hypothetical protein
LRAFDSARRGGGALDDHCLWWDEDCDRVRSGKWAKTQTAGLSFLDVVLRQCPWPTVYWEKTPGP